ncbi:MAG: hypothetical protein U0T36_03055 [Saprospiraceae bacterium]
MIKLDPEDKIGTAAELFLDNRFILTDCDEGLLVGLAATFDVLNMN